MIAALAALTLATAFVGGDNVPLTLIPSDAMSKVNHFWPIHLELSSQMPAKLRKAPPLTKPMYGSLEFQGKDHITILDEDAAGLKLYLDSNGDGDLTNDPPTSWPSSQYTAQDKKQYTLYRGSMVIDMDVDGKNVPVTLGVYKFDKTDPDHPDLVNTLLYYSDYAWDGQMSLDGKPYHIMLSDSETSGYMKEDSLVLSIDVNNSGRFDARGERFDVTEPFNIAGTTYKVLKVSSTSLEFSKSAKSVDAVPLPPTVGDKAPPFIAKTIDGRSIPFPSRYRGKLVMLFFWAISDDHSTKEIPGLIKAYEKYHAKGFEVLGIATDMPATGKDLDKYVKEHKIPWPVTWQGYPHNGDAVDLLVVRWLPWAFLVDGDTGKIVATIDSLRGDKLAPTVEKALAAKRGH